MKKDDTLLESWQTALLPMGATIKQAINSLEQSIAKILLVIDKNNKLIGTVTDGDIRRALLRDFVMNSKIDDMVNRHPIIIPPGISQNNVLKLMTANKIRQLPIINSDGYVVGLHQLDTEVAPNFIENVMFIMAGGKGSRLLPFTERCPKPMIEVSGQPILQHIIEAAKSQGFKKFIISLHYLGELIEDYFGDGKDFGVDIEYLRESKPLGTVGCLSLLRCCPKLPFVVTNGDILSNISFQEMINFHMRYDAVGTMAVRQHEIQNQFGIVRTQGIDIDGFEEKPIYRSYINAGIYVLSPEALSQLKLGETCDMPDLFQMVRKNLGRTIVYPMHEKWLDVGRPDELEIARNTMGKAR